jgi:hypothetical protein
MFFSSNFPDYLENFREQQTILKQDHYVWYSKIMPELKQVKFFSSKKLLPKGTKALRFTKY